MNKSCDLYCKYWGVNKQHLLQCHQLWTSLDQTVCDVAKGDIGDTTVDKAVT